MNHIFTIYKATNKTNNECYIGYDSYWPHRKDYHHYIAFKPGKIGYDYHFHRAIRKYGKEQFEWEIIYQSLDSDYCLNKMEPYFIKLYNSKNNGYNETDGGEGVNGYKHSEERKQKISMGGKGLKRSEETKKKIALTKLGKPRYDLKGENNYMYGKHHSDEMKLKMSLDRKGIVNNQYKNRIYKVITPTNEILQINNLYKFCKENNMSSNAMSSLAQGKYNKGRSDNYKGWKCFLEVA